MTATQFRAWRQQFGFDQFEAAAALDVSRRLVQYWESGERPIPRVVALACAAYALGLRDYPRSDPASGSTDAPQRDTPAR